MVSGKPPRRSKKNDDPVTIDLTATEVPREDGPAAESVEPVATPDATVETQAQASIEGRAPESAAVPETAPEAAPDDKPLEPEAPVSETPHAETSGSGLEESVQDAKQPEAEQTAGEKDAEPMSAFGSRGDTPPEDTAGQQVPPYEEKPAPRTQTATSTLIAAGIAGGLVALIGAGALQYAGILPAASPNKANAEIGSLAAQVQALKAEVAKGAGQGPDTSALEARIAKLETAPAPANPQAIDDLAAKAAAADQTLSSLRSEVTGRLQSLTESQTALSDRVSAIETKLNRPRDDIEVARAIAASALKTAVDRGGPFLSEMTTLKGIVPEEPALSVLEPYAASGVPSRTELLRRFGTTADRILSAINQPAESANIGERLWASALSVVKVRPVGNVEGDSPYAIVARIEDKIRNGDLKGAAAEWQSLPEAGRSASGDFKKLLDDRIAVENAVSDAMARAVNGRKG
ncbi:mitofilin family membrane protein [Rhizobium paknamense]|uniref:Inner membrane protein n=1 Tax=Rhizobium paknamense TaxID=1206817 RepID=A0ABU0IEH4_9HYPH|nr:mitofilin family membrane protein [Rhizobium paknamense]MDQ0456640.1 hypothetical protein [Rhizobium paknamense]